MHAIAPKPTPTQDECLSRRWLAIRLAIGFPWPEETLPERTIRAKRSLFVRWLRLTGRLSEPIS